MTPKERENLAARYRTWPKERLLVAATVQAQEYQPEAVAVMRSVLEETGVSPEAMTRLEAATVSVAAQFDCRAFMNVRGIESITREELDAEIGRGARFVAYPFCFSYTLGTVKRRSVPHFIRKGESRCLPSLRYVLCSLLLGWWGLPWGPFFTFETIMVSLTGGENLTDEVMGLVERDREYSGGKSFPWLRGNGK